MTRRVHPCYLYSIRDEAVKGNNGIALSISIHFHSGVIVTATCRFLAKKVR